MHDTIIANKIIEEAKQQGDVKAITVEVGEVSAIVREELEPTLTSMVGWNVTFKEQKAKAKCDCGYEGPPKILERGHEFCLFECPKCGATPEITEGKDIILKEVVV